MLFFFIVLVLFWMIIINTCNNLLDISVFYDMAAAIQLKAVCFKHSTLH